VLLADDNPRICEIVRSLLEPHFNILGSVFDGRALLVAAAKLLPDVIVTDLSMPVLNGLDAAKELRDSGSDAVIIFLTVHKDPDLIAACRAAGAAYVPKDSMANDLLPAIQAALASRS
jgi:DNA-binding NarL/FixJ family response regulator